MAPFQASPKAGLCFAIFIFEDQFKNNVLLYSTKSVGYMFKKTPVYDLEYSKETLSEGDTGKGSTKGQLSVRNDAAQTNAQ